MGYLRNLLYNLFYLAEANKALQLDHNWINFSKIQSISFGINTIFGIKSNSSIYLKGPL